MFTDFGLDCATDASRERSQGWRNCHSPLRTACVRIARMTGDSVSVRKPRQFGRSTSRRGPATLLDQGRTMSQMRSQTCGTLRLRRASTVKTLAFLSPQLPGNHGRLTAWSRGRRHGACAPWERRVAAWGDMCMAVDAVSDAVLSPQQQTTPLAPAPGRSAAGAARDVAPDSE